jgi:hypothetical protein
LKIDPFVFKELCIHPEKFTFDGRRYMKHVLQYTIVAGIFIDKPGAYIHHCKIEIENNRKMYPFFPDLYHKPAA